MLNFSLILNLLLILTVAWVLGLVFTRMGLPVMLGELLAGIILGPPILGIIGIFRPGTHGLCHHPAGTYYPEVGSGQDMSTC